MRSACQTREHPSYSRLVGRGCVPMAQAGGNGSGTAKAPLAVCVGSDTSELARQSHVLAQGGVRTSCRAWPLGAFLRVKGLYVRTVGGAVVSVSDDQPRLN